MADDKSTKIKFLGIEVTTNSTTITVLVVIIAAFLVFNGVALIKNDGLPWNSESDTIPISEIITFSDRNNHFGITVGVIPSERATITSSRGIYTTRAPKTNSSNYNVYVFFNDGTQDRPMFFAGRVKSIIEDGEVVRGEFSYTFPNQQ